MFDLRNNLLILVKDDAASFNMAHEFISDDPDKFALFQRAHAEQASAYNQEIQAGIQSHTAAALQVAKARWDIMYPSKPA